MKTAVTSGIVDGIGRYMLDRTRVQGMDGFRVVCASRESTTPCDGELSGHGDSGSVWYRQSTIVGVGLHVGGDVSAPDPNRQPAIACHLPRVIQRLGVSISPPEWVQPQVRSLSSSATVDATNALTVESIWSLSRALERITRG